MENGPRKPVSLRERQRQQTRAHLLEVAADLIGTKGFNATSIDDLAKAAGTSRATVYSYFDSKEAIIEEITRGLWDDADEIYGEFGELEDWDHASILGWLTDSVLARWEQIQPLHQAARKSSTTTLDSGYRNYADRYIASLTRNKALWRARFTPTETRRRALMLISMIDSYMSKLLTFGTEPNRVAVMETLTDVFRDVLRADE